MKDFGRKTGWFLLCVVGVLLLANIGILASKTAVWVGIVLGVLLVVGFVALNIHPDVVNRIKNQKLHHCAGGVFLLKLFLVTTVVSVVMFVLKMYDLGNSIWIFILELILFWNGIVRVYLYSSQLGIKMRVVGAVCGMIPVVHLYVLLKIIGIVDYEIKLESYREELNEKRKDDQICKTKYPVVMVHGVFFRDFKYFNYWGRIPSELEKNGAAVFYGNHESANNVADSGKQLAKRIKDVLKETGAKKVNIIAHSKGGLDCRYMISKCGMEDCVASLTTINTPHYGCEFADYLLNKVPPKQKQMLASTYNTALKALGDKNPDFIAAVTDLTSASCSKLNETVKDSDKVYYQSVGSKLNIAKGGRFPLNFSYKFVKQFDGPNDGLVGEKSFKWGSDFTFLTTKGIRGISHGDMIDLNRENIKGFDVLEFYVKLVEKLKDKGF